MLETKTDFWQDREVRFDVPAKGMEVCSGEFTIDSINSVEDTKGNNGERGSLEVSNLRLLWASHRNIRTNLSIGLNCVTNVSIKTANSRLRGSTQALYIMTRHGGSRFEFVFTSLVKASPRLFTTIQAVHRSYETTRLYRDLKLRGAIVKDKELILLPHEQVYSHITGVWNLSSDQGNLGSFFVTNIRLVWHANLAENFNVSMPYLQIKMIRIRDSKFGPALVMETTSRSGGYILGFRVDPEERLKELFQEVKSLHQVFAKTPIFGVEFTVEDKQPATQQLKKIRAQEDLSLVEEDEESGIAAVDVLTAYYAAANKNQDREVAFSKELGLAIESLPEGMTVENLWFVN